MTGMPVDQHQRLARNSAKAIAGTLLSRGSGVIRTLIVNASFGANIALDAFNTAFRFPNSLRDLLADGALSAAFIKVLVDISPQGDEAVREFIRIITGFFLCVTLVLAVLGLVFATPLMQLISGNQFAARGSLSLAVCLFQILVFYLPITMLNSIAMGVLAVNDAAFRAMNGSIFLSVGIIGGTLILAPLLHYLHYPAVMGIAVGAIIGALLQLIYQFYPLKKWGLLVCPDFNVRHWLHYKPLITVLRLMTPRALGQGALVLALMVNTYFAIQVGIGAITYVTTTVMIIQVPIGLFGVATGFAALPLISQAFREKKPELFNSLLTESLRTATWLSLFTLLGFALFIVPIYMIIFQHGKIVFHDTIQNSIAICAYGIGIFFAANSKILINALYAIDAARQIVINAIVYLVINISLTAWLTPHFGLIGLGISFATAAASDCWLNYWVVTHRMNKISDRTPNKTNSFVYRLFSLSLLSYVIGIVGISLCLYFWPHFTFFTGLPLNFLTASIILGIGALILLSCFLVLTRHFGPPELRLLLRKIF